MDATRDRGDHVRLTSDRHFAPGTDGAPHADGRARGGATASVRENLLERVAAGVRTAVHPSTLELASVLEVDRFNLWYGATQALFDVSMNVPSAR